MSRDNEYHWIKNATIGGFIIISIISTTFCKDNKDKGLDDSMYYFKYNGDYVGMWQNINKDMNGDTLYLEKCDTFCKVTFYDNGKTYTNHKASWLYRRITTDVWYRTAVKNRTHSFIEKNGISQSDISETLTLSDDGKTLTSVVFYYDKVNKKSVELGEPYIYRKIE